jgi:hypothetical protein
MLCAGSRSDGISWMDLIRAGSFVGENIMVKTVAFVEPIFLNGSGRLFGAGVGWCVLGRRMIYNPIGTMMATPLRLTSNLPDN